MARNRKRAKERRARRPQPVAGRPRRDRSTTAPSPLEHAAPDAEIAEQAELPPGLTEPELEELEAEEVPEDEELEESRSTRLGALAAESEEDEAEFEEEEDALDDGVGGGGRRRGRTGRGFDGGSSGGEAAAALPAPRVVPGNRLINFLQGSWRELQRVQWPDRQQVLQATGVVIGFVIVAGVFLGVADWAAGHLVSLIENGHF